jgi:hypothetical protein
VFRVPEESAGEAGDLTLGFEDRAPPLRVHWTAVLATRDVVAGNVIEIYELP